MLLSYGQVTPSYEHALWCMGHIMQQHSVFDLGDQAFVDIVIGASMADYASGREESSGDDGEVAIDVGDCEDDDYDKDPGRRLRRAAILFLTYVVKRGRPSSLAVDLTSVPAMLFHALRKTFREVAWCALKLLRLLIPHMVDVGEVVEAVEWARRAIDTDLGVGLTDVADPVLDAARAWQVRLP
jgi:hypothetical protein